MSAVVKFGLFFAVISWMILFIKNKLLNFVHAIFIGVLICTSTILQAATKEEAVKAGSVYNFTKFTSWPSDLGSSDTFNLCVFSENKPDEGLQALSGKSVADKPLVLRYNVEGSSISKCHMAFIAHDSQVKVQETLNKIKKMPILTVSASPDFIKKGGMIGLIKVGKHVGFEINIATTNAVGIHIGSQLLKLAKRVEGLN